MALFLCNFTKTPGKMRPVNTILFVLERVFSGWLGEIAQKQRHRVSSL